MVRSQTTLRILSKISIGVKENRRAANSDSIANKGKKKEPPKKTQGIIAPYDKNSPAIQQVSLLNSKGKQS